MNWIEVFGLIFSILGVYFTAQKLVIAWYFNIVASLIYAYLFYHSGLLADAELQIFFVGAAIYGIFQWNKQLGPWRAQRSTKMELSVGLAICIVAGMLIGAFHQYISHSVSFPYIDGLLSAGSIWATYLAAKQKIENWICWIIIDLAYIVVYLNKELYLTAGLYGLFVLMAWRGWRRWVMGNG